MKKITLPLVLVSITLFLSGCVQNPVKPSSSKEIHFEIKNNEVSQSEKIDLLNTYLEGKSSIYNYSKGCINAGWSNNGFIFRQSNCYNIESNKIKVNERYFCKQGGIPTVCVKSINKYMSKHEDFIGNLNNDISIEFSQLLALKKNFDTIYDEKHKKLMDFKNKTKFIVKDETGVVPNSVLEQLVTVNDESLEKNKSLVKHYKNLKDSDIEKDFKLTYKISNSEQNFTFNQIKQDLKEDVAPWKNQTDNNVRVVGTIQSASYDFAPTDFKLSDKNIEVKIEPVNQHIFVKNMTNKYVEITKFSLFEGGNIVEHSEMIGISVPPQSQKSIRVKLEPYLTMNVNVVSVSYGASLVYKSPGESEVTLYKKKDFTLKD